MPQPVTRSFRWTRVTLVGMLAGAFYLIVGTSGLFFLARYFLRGAPGPLWVSLLSVALMPTILGAGGWMLGAIRDGKRRGTPAFRHLSAGATASAIGAPLELYWAVEGFWPWAVVGTVFFAMELLIVRWTAADRQMSPSSEAVEAVDH